MARWAMALGAAAIFACLSGCATMHDAVGLTKEVLEPTVPGSKPVNAAAAAALSDEQIDQRLAFVSKRLDDNRGHAQWWQYGFLAVTAGGTAVEAATAATAVGSDRDFSIIEASKGLVGLVYLVAAPLPGRGGADPIREMPSATHDERAAQLAEAESILYAAGGRAHQRTGWALHAGNVAINAAGASVLLAERSYGKAALSFFLDAIIGEAQILLTPWEPATDWQDYQEFVKRGDVAAVPRVHWSLQPNGEGLALRVAF